MKKLLILLSCGVIVTGSYALSVPKSTLTDARIKLVQYDPNNVVALNGKYGYQTQIAFAPNEIVQNVSLGDSIAWQAAPVNHYLFVKPVAASKTNMTVLTNLNSYNFELNSENQKNVPTYKLQFLYPQGGFDQSGERNAVNEFNPNKINWRYSFTGDSSLAPIEAFDNGQFTYFKFKTDGLSREPSVFIVNKNRKETLVNYHMQGKYLVIHSIAKQFTLRNGDYVTSIYNDLAIGDWMNV